jgi:hypothetical protein
MLDRYPALTPLERERFAVVVNYLLSKNFLLSYTYENKTKIPKPNGDYNFVIRYFDLFSQYFSLANYRIERDDSLNIVYIHNEAGFNHIRLNKLQTLFLLGIRRLYDEEKESASRSDVIYTTIGSLINKMLMEPSLLVKKPTIEQTSDVMRFLQNINIITKVDKNFQDMTATICILPTITILLSPARIDAIYQVLFKLISEGGNENA